MRSIAFELLNVGATPFARRAVRSPQVLIFRDASAWSEFWGDRAAPSIDFARQMVIVVTAGARPTGGYRLEIDRITAIEPSSWQLHYTETTPGRACRVTQQPTTPAAFIVAETAPVAIELQGQTVAHACHTAN